MAFGEQPYSITAEQNVLGSMMLSIQAVTEGITALTKQDFYVDKHQVVYTAIENLYKRNQPVDITTVADELLNAQQLDVVGGTGFLSDLCNSVLSTSSMDAYVQIVKEKSQLRDLLYQLTNLQSQWENGNYSDVGEFFTTVEKNVTQITHNRRVGAFKKAGEIANIVANKLQLSAQRKTSVTGTPSGFGLMDSVTNGFQKGDLVILAARPSMGKTALAINFALNAARSKLNPCSVAVFSLEMSDEQTMQRMLATISNIPLDKLKKLDLTQHQISAFDEAMRELNELPIYIDDTPAAKLADIQAKARKLKAQREDLGLIVVDYLGLVVGSDRNRGSDNRQAEISEISRGLKAMARELDVPVISLSQLSRKVESRTDRRPILSDLRESGAIEQDADIVMFIYRGDYYHDSKDEKYELKQNLDPMNESIVELSIAKHRNGPTVNFDILFARNTGTFSKNYIAFSKRKDRDGDK